MSALTETITIENVVASTDIKHELALENLAMDLTGSDYDPENFPGLVYRIQDPKAAILIFRSGKIVCTGADSVTHVHTALDIVYQKLRALGIDITDDPPVTVQNIVSGADFGARLNLNAIAIGFGLENVEYEPEQFPGLVYRLDDPKVVILLFGSGKAVVTGAKTPDDAANALEKTATELEGLGLLKS